MSALMLLARYFSASVRGQLQYPGSAIALGVGQFLTTIIDILAAWALFDRFGPVQGWTFGDIALFFGMVSIITKLAPLGALGAMAFTIGKFGIGSLTNLLGLIATFYFTAFLFVIVVLGLIARFTGFSIFKFLRYIKEELLLVLGTSSSESALPHLMGKLEKMGCKKNRSSA